MGRIFRSSGIIRSRQNRGRSRGVHVVLYQPEIPANTGILLVLVQQLEQNYI